MISGITTATISNHLPLFLFAPNALSKELYEKLIFMKMISQKLFKPTLYSNI